MASRKARRGLSWVQKHGLTTQGNWRAFKKGIMTGPSPASRTEARGFRRLPMHPPPACPPEPAPAWPQAEEA